MSVEDDVDCPASDEVCGKVADLAEKRHDDLTQLATLVAQTCGYGSALDIGCGEGFMVGELLDHGIDTVGLDISAIMVERANTRWPGRIFHGSVLSLPFPDEHFDIVISTGCLEHVAPAKVPAALQEIYRVSSRYVFLQIATTQDRDGHSRLTVEGRAWWEARCFEAGFRKHALYYKANPYESLNEDSCQILVLLEKAPAEALQRYDLAVLTEERLLHTDMLREVGRRSDAHCIRYHKAAEFVRPGDAVLDVACGLGYGSHIIYAASQARSVLGVDLSDFGVAYATAHYGRPGVVEFRVGDAQALDFVPDNSIDFIAAFETIEHVPDPAAYLRELKRVLKPAGRVMVCAPNNWADETGKDPNPHHLHVYTWDRLVAEFGAQFLLEEGFLQTAGGAMRCHHAARKWVSVPADRSPEEDAEWVLLLGMSDPVAGQGVRYEETVWALPDALEFHVSAFARDYVNPWLVKGMVAMGMRARALPLIVDMQERVQASAAPNSVDYGAALCGRVYAWLQQGEVPAGVHQALDAEIRRYAAIVDASPHQLRWQVSLLFAGGELARRQGRISDAISFFSECARRDVVPYSPLLGNKVVDARYWLAVFALSRHEKTAARSHLLQAISETQRLVSGSWLNITGDQASPLPFGLAETAQLLDKASRAAYMLAALDGLETRPGGICRESLGFFERQLVDRDRRIRDLSKAVDELSSVLADKEQTCSRLAGEIVAGDGRAQDLAAEVAQHDAHAQALALEVAKQDAHAQELAREVAKQDAHAQDLARELAKQDAHAQELAREVAKQDAHAQELAREVAKRDAYAQELAREVAAKAEDAARSERDLGEARAEIERLLDVIRKQEEVLAYFRPKHWLGILRRLFTKRKQ